MEFRKQQAIYLQIGDYICENILRKMWREGDRIPSVRELAVDIEVNPNTVMRAYADLQEKRILRNKRGIGYFISDDAFEKTRQLQKAEFISHDLPRLFNILELLGMKLEELTEIYQTTEKRQGTE